MASVIGQGLQGTVVANTNTVVKTISANTAEKEKRAADILKQIDSEQEYTLYGVSFTPKNRKVNITMKHGGESLNKFSDMAYVLRYSKPTDEKLATYKKIAIQFQPEIPKIIASFDSLLAWLPKMHKAGIANGDIGPQNLVWDGEHLRMIDWGYSVFSSIDFESEKEADVEGLRSVKEEFQKDSEFILKTLGLNGGGFKRKYTKKTRKIKIKNKK
jgi:hypothetical protein